MASETNKGILYDTDQYGDVKTIHFGRVITVGLLGLFLLIILFGGIYRLNTGEGAIYTSVNGVKTPITAVGIGLKIPLFTTMDYYSTVNQNIYFPQDYISLEQQFKGDAQSGAVGFDIKTTDDKVVDVGAKMEFQIIDAVQYGVMNTNPAEQLQKAFDAIVFNYLQTLDSNIIINDIENVNSALLGKLHASNIEKQYGIQINNFALLRPTYTKKALDAMSEKQAIQAVAEGKLNAADSEAKAIEKIANAMKLQSDILANIPVNQLDFNAKMTLYNNLKGQTNVIWVIPDTTQLNIVAK
jgi:regulator of protease activity HflC (stomatin/prohibitin superfamily)